MFVDNFLKKLSIILLLTSFSYAEGLFDKPFAICSSIKSYQAYEMASAIKNQCDPQNVVMSIKDLHKTFLPMMTDEYASSGRCNTECAILNGLNGQSHGDCVKHRTNVFVKSAVSSGSYNKSTCLEMKSRIK